MIKFVLLALFSTAAFINAQSDTHVESGIFKINALIPGASYELGLGTDTTLNFDVLLIPAARGGTDRDTEFGILPGAQAEFRYFTNMNRRLSKGKNIAGNSGNFVALTNQFFLSKAIIGNFDYGGSFTNIVALTYGIQRTRPKGFYWGVSFGPGVAIDEIDTEFSLFVDAKLGWVLTKRK